MKMDIKLLAKEGLRIEATKNSKFSLGDLSIEFWYLLFCVYCLKKSIN